jgi:nitroreductase/Pyruvate/2-oxoacid:ferredoxin oxidoreductase delta subunit
MKKDIISIEFDEAKCSRCMLCVRDCTGSVLRNVNGLPRAVEPEWCNLCSHCIAVCPQDAVTHTGLDANQIRPVDPGWFDPEHYRAIVQSRRSVRRYRNTPVTCEKIEEIIKLSRYAPTASNDENVGYVMITDKALIKRVSEKIFSLGPRLYAQIRSGAAGRVMDITGLSKIGPLRRMDHILNEAAAGRDVVLHHAPVLILLYAPRPAPLARDNCLIAATTLINYAHSLGLGTCFIGYLTVALRFSSRLRKQLGVPRGNRVHASLVMGYPAYGFSRTVSRKDPEIIWKG